jgi:hypothetical protein
MVSTLLSQREVHLPWKHRSTDLSEGEEHMTQKAALELLGDAAGQHSLGECSPSPSAGLSCNFDSLLAKNAAVSETVDDVVGPLFGARRWIGRSEARGRVSASLWLTSLQNPGVFEVVPTENVSRFGIQMVTQKFWEVAEMVLVSFPPEFCVQGSVAYCKKLPSGDYILGIRLDAPVERWVEALRLKES